MRILAVLAFSILYLSANVEATVEITEARIAGESDAKNLDKWKFKRFTVGFCGSATPIMLLSALGVGEAAWGISCNYNPDPTVCCVLYGIGALLPFGEALIRAPKPPAQRLLGKSPEWVNAYTKAYQASMKKRNMDATWMGCLTGAAVSAPVLYLIMVATTGVKGD